MANSQATFQEVIPPLQGLLSNGIPDIHALDTYIADLDLDLEENTKQLNDCLQDLLNVTNSVVGKEYVTPRDALLSMLSNHILEKDSCYDPEPDLVTDILSHATHTLDTVPGSEEAVFQDLLSLSSEQGLSLPLKSAVVDPIASTMSLNAVSDNSEIQIAQQWDQLALRLRRYFMDKLASLPVCTKPPEVDLMNQRRLKYLQSLITLQPVEEVWERYQSLRKQQLDKCLSSLTAEGDPENLDILKISENCLQIAEIIIQMMNEDFTVLNSGVLKKPPNIFKAFHKIYLDKYTDDLSFLVDEVWDEIRDSLKRGPSQSFSTQGSRGKGKPPKPGTSSLLRGQAQSLDSVVNGNENPGASFEGEPAISVKYLKATLNLLQTILQIEEHVDNLQRASIWDVGGLATKKAKRKGSLKGVLKTSSSPEVGRRPNSANLSSMDSESWMSDSVMSSYASDSSMLFDVPIHPKVTVVEKMKLEEKIKWDWKIIFKKIGPELANCVDRYIRDAMSSMITREQEGWSNTHSLTTVTVKETLWGGRLDYPKVISRGVSEFMAALEMCALFAKGGNEGSLHAVRTSFIDSSNLCLKNIHAHLLKLSCDIPVSSPIRNLYIILSNAAYIRNYLLHFDTVLSPEESIKKPFSLQYKEFVELVETLTELVIQTHNNYIATSVLHDGASNFWTDSKEFFEGERCSFPIQMWNYYVRGIQYDMWLICPPKLAQSMFSQIVHDSLQMLVQRYAAAKPSFRRVDQFRMDIISILLCVHEMLFPASNSISRCIDAGHSQLPHYSIHNLCTTLLSVMAIVTSPLDTLHKVNKKGYRYRQKRKSFQQSDRGCNTNWLSWLQSDLMEKGVKSYDNMRTTTAVYLHTKLLLCQPEINYPLTLQAFLMKDYTLAILFLTQASMSVKSFEDSKSKSLHDQDGSASPIVVQKMAGKIDSVKRFMGSALRVLLQAAPYTDGLYKVIEPVIERNQEWTGLDAKHIPGKDINIPIWLTCLLDCLRPFNQRVLKPVLDYVLCHSEDKQIHPISTVIEELPCGCRSHASITPRSSRKSDEDHGKSDQHHEKIMEISWNFVEEEGREMLDTVLKLLMQQISEDVFILPTPLCVMFKALEQQCVTKGIKTPHHCVGLKILAISLREYLLDTAQISHDLGMMLGQITVDRFVMLADCVYHVLASGKVKGSTTPRLAGKFCRENKDWINEKVQILITYLGSDIFEMPQSPIHQGAPTEFFDQLYQSITSDILSTPTGKEDLDNLYWMVSNNEEWLQKQLDIKLTLPLVNSESAYSFTVDLSTKQPASFNPIVEQERIGRCKFDHSAISAIQLDWDKLLQSDLGLSDLGFRALLFNRHEMQDGAYLEEKEKKPVANLKSVFDNEPRELG